MGRGDLYQVSLIGLGVAATALLGHFLYREIFPEYKIYQDDYVELEKFRSTYTGSPPPEFKVGVKQIVLLREDKGPPVIDRCVSCHVALQFEHFSPTTVALDSNGNPTFDKNGVAIQIPNKNYVWSRLEEKIDALKKSGDNQLAQQYEKLKTAEVGEHIYDVTKVLKMHPLMGKETRPFEFHPIEEYGCVVCHNGNGRGLTTDKAHGPVFDGQYEVEDMGPSPSFLEIDPENDPPFSKVFNHKPGHELLFQTNPLYVGSLLQAKCVQCHQSSVGTVMDSVDISSSPIPLPSLSKKFNAIDLLTHNFKRGQSLFISQACYACHRIAGLSRGGVGPELTREGYSYPWFVKESIVWPQADLKTSTMPNYQMDHDEVEDLLTFLLAQTGENQTISPMAYKTTIQQWEAGKKLPWEKAVTPTQVLDLDASLKIFATEGCAACHRLRGYESDVGFAVQKDPQVSFDKLYQEKEWFRNLVPETIIGSELAAVLEKHSDEIDRRIISNAKEKGILNSIEEQSPETIESYYSNFKFASRVKKDEAWKERLHRVLMMYIQEYGLGRLVGPRPSWSGVYRSDEWLMEHFKNPSAHVPRSIMPVFPFDETKFYALTHLLDVLGVRNRNADHAVWSHKGFNPEVAYQMYCSQCHGTNLHGNGPVAEWIYPVPKNLRNSDFLRQLTKERAIQSITYGVQGTPMAPWGVAAADKPTADQNPVLAHEEIAQLVDWLFAGLPGGQVLKGSEDVPKWKYSAQDVLSDLKREGNEGKFKLKDGEIFDLSTSSINGPDHEMYWIKREYYTPQNLLAGQEFFELNCAACHGRDADGSGLRAGAMQEAKPRMLVNFDWINSRDDLRLIRSIKYGVGGTSMTPWGDQTNSLQRLQLVMFIRSLSEEKKERRIIENGIYSVFDQKDQQLEQLRSREYQELDQSQKALNALLQKKSEIFTKVTEGDAPSKTLLELVEQEVSLIGKINALKEKDQQLINLKQLLKTERDLYLSMGTALMQLRPNETVLNNYTDYLKALLPRVTVIEGKDLSVIQEAKGPSSTFYYDKLVNWLQTEIKGFESERENSSGLIDSEAKTTLLTKLNDSIASYSKVEKKLVSTEKQGIELRTQQRDLVNIYNTKKK